MSSVQFLAATSTITASLTADGLHSLIALTNTSVTVGLTAEGTVTRLANANTSIIVNLLSDGSRTYLATTIPLAITAKLTFKIKRYSPLNDHDIQTFGEIFPRRWYAELSVQRDDSIIVAPRNYEAIMATRRWGAILGDRNNTGSLQETRWKAYLQ